MSDELIELRGLVVEDKVELALSKLRRFIREHPHDAEAYVLSSAAYLRAHQPEEALRAADAALRVDPDRAEAWHFRAKALLELGQVELALRSSTEAAEREPMIVAYLTLRTRLLLRSGDAKEAQRAAATLQTLAPNEPDGRLLEARALQLQGKYKAARGKVEAVLADFPLHTGARKLLLVIETEGSRSKARSTRKQGRLAKWREKRRRQREEAIDPEWVGGFDDLVEDEQEAIDTEAVAHQATEQHAREWAATWAAVEAEEAAAEAGAEAAATAHTQALGDASGDSEDGVDVERGTAMSAPPEDEEAPEDPLSAAPAASSEGAASDDATPPATPTPTTTPVVVDAPGIVVAAAAATPFSTPNEPELAFEVSGLLDDEVPDAQTVGAATSADDAASAEIEAEPITLDDSDPPAPTDPGQAPDTGPGQPEDWAMTPTFLNWDDDSPEGTALETSEDHQAPEPGAAADEAGDHTAEPSPAPSKRRGWRRRKA